MKTSYDAIIIGGGFFGCNIAHFLRQRFSRVLIVEREDELLTRASFANQARVHNGYHYPRSYVTAYRSRINYPRFVQEYQPCMDNRFTKLYCIARYHSKVNSRQFEKFCANIGAACQPASAHLKRLFSPRLIEGVYEVEEMAFDANCLREHLKAKLARAEVEILLGTSVIQVIADKPNRMFVQLNNGQTLTSQYVFNCTYSGVNHIPGTRPTPAAIKHEITEINLIKVPEELQNLGITVMDGAFFSVMPFPAKQLHSLF